MAITISGTNGIVGAGFTLDASGASVTAGVGTFGSLNAPASGLTGALPAISAASCTSIPAANIVGLATAGFSRSGGFPQGVTEADLWRVTSTLSLSNQTHTTLTSNWERPDATNDGFNYLGTGMSVDGSGFWTFPSTGYWYITFNVVWYANGNGSGANWIYIYATEDNSTYATQSLQGNSSANGEVMGSNTAALVDVTSVSNVKVKFNGYAGAANQQLYGTSTQNRTYATFTRLADT